LNPVSQAAGAADNGDAGARERPITPEWRGTAEAGLDGDVFVDALAEVFANWAATDGDDGFGTALPI
jgi:hypothetical protein